MATDGIRIVPITDAHIAGFRDCVDVVARERRYLGLHEGPPVEKSRAWVHAVLDGGGVHVVALDADDRVVGWCDIRRFDQPDFDHAGRLGIGLLPGHRDRGLGRRLMTDAIARARALGMERIELGVFGSNARAIALYERLGFAREGLRRRARKIDGAYDDDVIMGLVFDIDEARAGGLADDGA